MLKSTNIKKRRRLKEIVKSFIKHPFHYIEEQEGALHPEIEQEIKEHIMEAEEKKAEEARSGKGALHPEVGQEIEDHITEVEEERPKESIEDEEEKTKEGAGSRGEVVEECSEEKKDAEYVSPESAEYTVYIDGEIDPTDAVIEDFREGVIDYKSTAKQGTKEDYEPMEEDPADKFEEIRRKRLETMGTLPSGPLNYLNPIRTMLKKLFLGKYK